MDRKRYSAEQLVFISQKMDVGPITYQVRIAQNTGKPIEVGYVYVNGSKSLFCKRDSLSDLFILCNEYEAEYESW